MSGYDSFQHDGRDWLSFKYKAPDAKEGHDGIVYFARLFSVLHRVVHICDSSCSSTN
jgi:hypothetical protein